MTMSQWLYRSICLLKHQLLEKECENIHSNQILTCPFRCYKLHPLCQTKKLDEIRCRIQNNGPYKQCSDAFFLSQENLVVILNSNLLILNHRNVSIKELMFVRLDKNCTGFTWLHCVNLLGWRVHVS